MDNLKEKFKKKYTTASGHERAFVKFSGLKTLWFNTGTLCNISCEGCYIESSPINNKLLYLNVKDVEEYLKQIKTYNLPCELDSRAGLPRSWPPELTARADRPS